jgi:hypothetical protein
MWISLPPISPSGLKSPGASGLALSPLSPVVARACVFVGHAHAQARLGEVREGSKGTNRALSTVQILCSLLLWSTLDSRCRVPGARCLSREIEARDVPVASPASRHLGNEWAKPSASRNATTQSGHDNRPLYPRGEPCNLALRCPLDQPLQRICSSSSFCLAWSDQLRAACRTLWGRLSGAAEQLQM